MNARLSPCTMRMTLFREALLLADNLMLLSFFQILRSHFQGSASAAIAMFGRGVQGQSLGVSRGNVFSLASNPSSPLVCSSSAGLLLSLIQWG
jgi:hypothetical protein